MEIEPDYPDGIIARAIDAGEEVWQGDEYTTLDEALYALEAGIRAWFVEHGDKDD